MIEPRKWNLGFIDQGQVNVFANAALDHNEIHLSKEGAAKAGLMDGPIVHGMLIYGFVERCLAEIEGHQLRQLSLQFVRPLLVGAELQIEARPLKEEQGEILLRVLCRSGERQLNAIAEARLAAIPAG